MKYSCICKEMNILVENSAKQRLEEGQNDLRYGLESAGGAGADMKT
jgi:hypothetical protein